MKKILLFLATVFFSVTVSAAEWEMVYELNAAYGFYITKDGVMLMSDYDGYTIPGDGPGIIYSENNGLTWEKTGVKDYYFSQFHEYGDYVYALGYGCRIARSDDGGRTWEMLNYSRALAGVPNATADNLASSACYGLVLHEGRLFASDFSFGVVVSDDWGETWQSIGIETLTYNVDDGGKGKGQAVENLYMLSEYNGTLLAYGLYNVFKFNDTTEQWEYVRNSNCMAVNTIYKGELFTGCSMPNDNFDTPFLHRTTDLVNWGAVGHPKGVMDTNVRALSSDDARIYAALQWGGVFMTSDEGQTWHAISEGLPHVRDYYGKEDEKYISTLQVVPTKDYLYAVMYNEPWNASQHTSGLYRIAMKDLEEIDPTGVQNVSIPLAPAVSYDLQGRRTQREAAGIYLNNGKKIIR